MFDPALPANNSPLSSAEMRAQLTGLNDLITAAQAGAQAYTDNAITGTSNNSNNVATLGQGAAGSYDQGQMQQVLDKIDELITALRR